MIWGSVSHNSTPIDPFKEPLILKKPYRSLEGTLKGILGQTLPRYGSSWGLGRDDAVTASSRKQFLGF